MEVYEKALKVVDIKMTFRCSKEVVVSRIQSAAFIWMTKLKAKLHINQAFHATAKLANLSCSWYQERKNVGF